MYDLFGNKVNMEEFKNTRSPYRAFKFHNNYRKCLEENMCGSCKYLHCFEYHDKRYYKCELIGFSKSEATDIRKSYVCDKFERGGER